MNSVLKRLVAWIGDNLLGHAIIEGGKAAFTKSAQEVGGKVGEQVMKKFTTEDRLEAQLLLTQAQFTHVDGFFEDSDREGAKKINEYYRHLSRKKRERFEKLVGHAWSVMKDNFGAPQVTAPANRAVSFKDSPQGMFMKHFAEVGTLGNDAITLELDKLEKTPAFSQVTKTLDKGFKDLFAGINEGLRG